MNLGKVRYICPTCESDVTLIKRVCWGTDPHKEYRCDNYRCIWSGRNPNYVIVEDPRFEVYEE